jgi:hypothetical protein
MEVHMSMTGLPQETAIARNDVAPVRAPSPEAPGAATVAGHVPLIEIPIVRSLFRAAPRNLLPPLITFVLILIAWQILCSRPGATLPSPRIERGLHDAFLSQD